MKGFRLAGQFGPCPSRWWQILMVRQCSADIVVNNNEGRRFQR